MCIWQGRKSTRTLCTQILQANRKCNQILQYQILQRNIIRKCKEIGCKIWLQNLGFCCIFWWYLLVTKSDCFFRINAGSNYKFRVHFGDHIFLRQSPFRFPFFPVFFLLLFTTLHAIKHLLFPCKFQPTSHDSNNAEDVTASRRLHDDSHDNHIHSRSHSHRLTAEILWFIHCLSPLWADLLFDGYVYLSWGKQYAYSLLQRDLLIGFIVKDFHKILNPRFSFGFAFFMTFELG